MEEQTQVPDRKALQAAIKDLNKVLQPSPKLNFIASEENLRKSVMEAVAGCIGTDKEGNPVWSNPKGAELAKETVDAYAALVAAQPAEARFAEAAKDPEEGGECEAFERKLGPKEGDEGCLVCTRLDECVERNVDDSGPLAAGASGPTRQEREAIKERAKAAKKREREAIKASKKAAREASGEASYSWVQAVCDAVRSGPKTKEQIMEEALSLYQEKGKAGNLVTARRNVDTYLGPLIVIGAVKEEAGIITCII